jgi:very-short-patch-repair endonuclease
VVDLAVAQHGVVAAWQLRELGVGRETVRAWAAAGYLHRVLYGVYAVGHPALTPRARMMAALLAGGRGAALSHHSAAVVWDLQAVSTPIVDVSVPRSRRGRGGIRTHRPRQLGPVDRTVEDGFQVTTASRTIFDLAGMLPRARIRTMWETADRRGLLDVRRIEALCAAMGQGRNGTPVIRLLLAETSPPPFTRSELERRFTELCRANGLPTPGQNVFLHGYEVDAYWPEHGLVVELDGFEFHRTRRAFERDNRRDAVLAAAGLRVLRLGWREVVDEPALAVRALRQGLLRP